MDRHTLPHIQDRDHPHDAPTLFVHEFVAGGGFAGSRLPTGLLSEGLAMLSSLLTDLARHGHRRIITTADERIATRFPASVQTVRVGPGTHRSTFRALSARADEVWIVAPETGGRLADLTELATGQRARIVGSSPEAVRLASDKLSLARRLAEAGLPVPRTWAAVDAEAAVRTVGFPLVVKPASGAGGEGVGLARDGRELATAIEAAARSANSVLIQEFSPGLPASAAILCGPRGVRPLALNAQNIRLRPSFRYVGGHTPLSHSGAKEALHIACSVCRLIPGLAGYVGVDLVLDDSGCRVIEVNPRLTTAYVGLRVATRTNLAALILDALTGARSPDLVIERTVRFTADGRVRPVLQ